MKKKRHPSIIQDEKECYFCGNVLDLDLHHVMSGTNRRHLADEDGLTVYLCRYHHNKVHQNRELNLLLKRVAQRRYMEYYDKTLEEYLKRYEKSFL